MNEVLRSLASAIIDGTASAADAERLSAMLRDQPDLWDDYLNYLDTHAALCWQYRDLACATPATPVTVPVARSRSGVVGWVPRVLAALSAVVAVVMFLRPAAVPDIDVPVPGVPGPSSDSSVAVLVDGANAEFAPGMGPKAAQFGPGEYELVRGAVHLRFTSGAEMVLASPAKLRIRDALNTQLLFGKIRVSAPPSAHGFTVATPGKTFIDLGTEFGLQVDPGSGASDLYVFDGQVNVADPTSGRVISEVLGGRSTRWSLHGKLEDAPRIAAGDFPTPGSIGFKRWEAYQTRLRSEASLLGFFTLQRGQDDSMLSNDSASRRMPNGRVMGARWTTGRWPGKNALLFDRDSDFAELSIPGEHQDLSVSVWMKVDRFDFELNAILDSDGYDLGGIHLQFTRQGYPRGGVIVEGNIRETSVAKPVPLGRWFHYVSVLSTRDRTHRMYVNGVLARERHWLANQVIRPGTCRLGNWLPSEKWTMTNRAFRGSVDEVAIWNRPLSEAEIQRLYETGRPQLPTHPQPLP
ncbi:MAG: LamG domain-containing protein [Gemmataceae bacterium]|nr:LamG domain-containing protein [Gemmataceae bacterium]